MLSSRLSAVLSLLLALAGCSGSMESRAARECQEDIREAMVRPETVEFLEFEPISEEVYVDQFTALMIEGFADQVAGDALAAATRDLAREHAQRMTDRGASFYRYRLRSPDRVGNAAASSQLCAASADACVCVSPERISDYRASRPDA